MSVSMNNRGQVLVFVALAIFAILGLAALGIDVGYMYSVRHELQRCADAGALAGAAPFTTQDWNDASVRTEADTLARDFATKDPVVRTLLDRYTEVDVTFPPGRYGHIAVDTSRIVDLFFARIFGMTNKKITAHAMAKVSNTDEKACVKPWAVPLPWKEVDGDNLFDLDNQEEADSVHPMCAEGVEGPCWDEGTQITLKIGSPSSDNTSPSGQQTSGQFFIIQGNTTNAFQGANEYREYISGDKCLDINLTDPIDLMPGNKMGPTVQPVQKLIDSGPEWNGVLSEFPEKPGDRLVTIVMYDPRTAITNGGGQTGSSGTQAYIPGNTDPNKPNLFFAGFYLDNIVGQGNDGWVTGRYKKVSLNGTQADSGNPTGKIATHVELVE